MKNSNDIFTSNILAAKRDLFKYWYLIAISLVIAIGIALAYIKFSARTYRVGSSILLKIDKNQNYGGGSDDILKAFDFMIQDKTFQNEIYFIQSLPLVREVVNEMDLRVSYFMQEEGIPKRFTFSRKNIYKDSPFIVIPNEGHLQPVNLDYHLKIIDDERFLISATGEEISLMDFSREQIVTSVANYNLNGAYKFGSPIETENSSFTVVLNSNFNPADFIGKDLFFRFNHLNHLASYFKNSLSVSAQGIESTMAEITFNTENHRLGTDFLNVLTSKYIENNIDEANLMANKTIEHIDRQLVDVSGDLNVSEQQLQNIRSNHSIMNIDEKAENIHNQLNESRNLRDEAQRRLNHLEQLNDHFIQYKDSSRILAPSSLGLTDPLLNNLIQELTTLNSEKQRIISQDQIKSPRLQTIDISIETLKNAIEDNLSFTINTARREISNLNEKINELNSEFAELPGTQRELLGIERRFNLNDAIYTSLLERRIQAQIIKASKLPDAKIIEPPRYMGIAKPNKIIILFLAIFAGLSFPTVLILLRKIIANRVSNKEDIKIITSIPVIGSISHNDYSEQNIVKAYPSSPLTEAFHILRSNLVYYLHGNNNQTILVTSSIPGEGKSFSAVNLATSFAMANSKTILVEFDLRNPNRYADAFKANELVGLSSYLINKATLDEITVPSDISNLDIIQAGQIPPNPVELISGEKTSELLNELKEQYDYIILDTPPYGLVTDSFLLMHHADIKIFVTRLGYTKKRALSANAEDIESKNIDNLYILMNDDKEDKMGYGKYTYMKKEKKSTGISRRKIAVF